MGPETYTSKSDIEMHGFSDADYSLETEFANAELAGIESMREEVNVLTPEKTAVIDLTTLLVDRQGPELSADDKLRIRQMISVGLQEIFDSPGLTAEERDTWQVRVEPRVAFERQEHSGIKAAKEKAELNNEDYFMPGSWAKASSDFAIMTGAESVEVPDNLAEIIADLGHLATSSSDVDTQIEETIMQSESEPSAWDDVQDELAENYQTNTYEEVSGGLDDSGDIDMSKFEEDVQGEVLSWEEARAEKEIIDIFESQFAGDHVPAETEEQSTIQGEEESSVDDTELDDELEPVSW